MNKKPTSSNSSPSKETGNLRGLIPNIWKHGITRSKKRRIILENKIKYRTGQDYKNDNNKRREDTK